MKFIEHHRKGRSLIFNGKTKTWQVILFCLPAHDYDLIRLLLIAVNSNSWGLEIMVNVSDP